MTRARYRSQLSLLFRHPSRDVSVVCKAIGLRPKVVRTKGDPLYSPKGVVIGHRDSSYCTAPLSESDKDDLPEQLARAVRRLKRHRAALRRFTRAGGTLSFCIGWFLNDDSGATLKAALLKDLADLGISLDFHVYGPEESPDVP